MQKIYLLNVTLTILILALSFFTGSLLAQTPGSVFHQAQDIKSGTFGSNVGGGNYFFPANGNVGIGTTSPLQKLHVAGTAQVDGAIVAPEGTLRDDAGGWVRTYGATGWFSQTYGGGWYMTDSTYVRTYNDKPIYIGAGNSYFGGNIEASNQITAGTMFKTGGTEFTSSYGKIGGNLTVTGNVGIGTTTPGEKLEVNGNIKLSGSTPTYKITNLSPPTASSDAATKGYVDSLVDANMDTPSSYVVVPLVYPLNEHRDPWCPDGWSIVTSWSTYFQTSDNYAVRCLWTLCRQ